MGGENHKYHTPTLKVTHPIKRYCTKSFTVATKRERKSDLCYTPVSKGKKKQMCEFPGRKIFVLVRGGLTLLRSSLCTLHTLTAGGRSVLGVESRCVVFRERLWSLWRSVWSCSNSTYISCRGWLISILSLFTAGSVGPLDASASLPRSLISSEKDASSDTGGEGLLVRFGVSILICPNNM